MKLRVHGDSGNKNKGQISEKLWRRNGHGLTTGLKISREEGKGHSGHVRRKQGFLLMKLLGRQPGGSVG